MKKEIKSVSVGQASKVLSLVIFIVIALFAVPAAIYHLFKGHDKNLATLLFMVPFFYLIASFIINAIFFFLYNLIAKMVGGIQIEVDDRE